MNKDKIIKSFINRIGKDQCDIYWNDISFAKSRQRLSLKEKREKTKRTALLKSILFEHFDSLNKEIYMLPYFDSHPEIHSFYDWFNDFTCRKRLKKTLGYKEVIEEANNCGFYLQEVKIIPYKNHKALAEKLFRANTNYLSDTCFYVPEIDVIYYPTHRVELVMYGDKNSEDYNKIAEDIFSKSDKLLLWKEYEQNTKHLYQRRKNNESSCYRKRRT